MNAQVPAIGEGRAQRWYRWLQWPCLAAICIFAFSDQIFPDVGHVAQVLFILPALVLLFTGVRPSVLRMPAVFLLLALVIQLFSWLFAPDLPGYELETTPHLDRMGRWMLFIFIAFWLLGKPAMIKVVWLSALAGLLLAPWVTGGGSAELLMASAGHRVDFGLRNAQHTAMLFGAGCLVLYATLLSRIADGKFLRITTLLVLVMLVMASAGLLVTQTRAVWLGFAAGFVLISAVMLLVLRYRQHGSLRRTLQILSAVVPVLVLLTLLASSLFVAFDKGRGEIPQLAKLEMDALEYDSIGIRLRSWVYAVPWIMERPLTGWGIHGSHAVTQQSGALPDSIKADFAHLHSSYIDLSVQYGLPAVLLLLAMMSWLGWCSWRSWRAGAMPDAVFLFVGGFIVFWLIVNAFESYMLYSTGRYLFNLVLAGALVYHPSLVARQSPADGGQEY
jgi:O-antigen ligase